MIQIINIWSIKKPLNFLTVGKREKNRNEPCGMASVLERERGELRIQHRFDPFAVKRHCWDNGRYLTEGGAFHSDGTAT